MSFSFRDFQAKGCHDLVQSHDRHHEGYFKVVESYFQRSLSFLFANCAWYGTLVGNGKGARSCYLLNFGSDGVFLIKLLFSFSAIRSVSHYTLESKFFTPRPLLLLLLTSTAASPLYFCPSLGKSPLSRFVASH